MEPAGWLFILKVLTWGAAGVIAGFVILGAVHIARKAEAANRCKFGPVHPDDQQ